MVRIWFLTEGARKIESWGPGITRLGRRRSWRRVSWVPEIPRRTAAKVVLESWCYTRKGVQRYSRRIAAQFQGIPSSVALGTNSPEGGRGGPWGLELYQECWNSGGPWVLVLYQEDWDRSGPRGGDWIPGNSSGVALGTNSPDDGDDSIYTNSSKGRWYQWGSVIYTRVAWVTASTGSQLFKVHTGSLTLAWRCFRALQSASFFYFLMEKST